MALVAIRRAGIHPFCVTIDQTAREYLPRRYGPASWVLIDDVRKLPLKAADVDRRLTN